MAETQAARPVQSRILDLFQNPVTVKELRSRMRGRRAFIVLTGYLIFMGGFIALVYGLFVATSSSSPFGPSSRQAGKAVFAAVVGVEGFLVLFIGPALTASSITGEKERQTYDLLRTTLLPARSLVRGKLLSALSYLILLVIASIPLQSIAFLLGGVSPIEVVLSQLLVVVTAVAYAQLGLFFSTYMRSTLVASITTFAVALVLTVGTPLVVAIITGLLGSVVFGPMTPSWTIQALLLYGGIALAATNLPATLIVSELFLLEQDSLFFYRDYISGHLVYLISPWVLYLIFFTLLFLILYLATVRRVRRVADK
jgi:ABC-2 type transport system permease protein